MNGYSIDEKGVLTVHDTSVTTMDLSGTNVTDLTPLAGLTGMGTLYLSETNVTDLSPLAGLAGMQTLCLFGTQQVSDLSPLAGLIAAGLRVYR